MLRPHRFEHEIDPGRVQIQARKVHFDVSGIPLHWIPAPERAAGVMLTCVSRAPDGGHLTIDL